MQDSTDKIQYVIMVIPNLGQDFPALNGKFPTPEAAMEAVFPLRKKYPPGYEFYITPDKNKAYYERFTQ